MFSLFTQVWLWSAAAFAVGALLTWLLFVIPLRRRSARLAAELRDVRAEVDEYADFGSEYDEPFDLLDPDSGDERGDARQYAVDDRRWDDDPDDLHRAVSTAPYVTRSRAPEPGSGTAGPGPAEEQEPPTHPAVQPPPAPRSGRPRAEASPAGETSGGASPDAESGAAVPSVAESPADETGESATAESAEEPLAERSGAAAGSETAGSGEPADPPAWSSGVLDAEQAGGLSGNLRWQRPVLNGTAGEHGIEEAVESGPRGSSSGQRADDAESDSTQVIQQVAEDGEQPPALPRRTPGSGPRPGNEGGGGGAPVVKGHSASRQYHTPASPHYSKIPADVWFRTPVDAEIAGFEPWDGRRVR